MMRLEQRQEQTVRMRINYLLNDIDIEFAEIVTILVGFLGGLLLVLPGDTFAMSRTFDGMSRFPDWSWGLWLMGLALAQGTALVQDRIRGRQVLAMLIFVTWFIIDVTFWRSAWRSYGAGSLGAVFVIAFWFSAGWAYLRLDKQRKVPHGLERNS